MVIKCTWQYGVCWCVLLLVSSFSCSCKVMEALYVLKTFAVRPGMRELRCLFSMLVCSEKNNNQKIKQNTTQKSGEKKIKITASTRWHCVIAP